MRGYKLWSLHKAYQWALSQNREDLLYKPNKSRLNKSNTKNQGQTRLISTYNNNDADIRNIIYKHWDILSKDPTLGQWVTSRPLFTFKKNTSIGNLLTQSHFQKQPNKSCCKTLGSFRCGDCEQCRFIKPSKMFGKTGLEFKMYHSTCCTTTHVIYLFTCHYGSLYVGKTKRPLKRRIYEHLLDIKNCNLLSSIAKHINCAHGGIFAGSFFQGIDRIHGDLRGGGLDKRLLQLETTWIFKLDTYKSELELNGHLNFQAFI
ncbi:hypothetical protein XELAEV_18000979mg [Xenopus laevis]|nr:hypothetical protein XELAEV_18000979mg [Xenopus laevis]